MSLALIIENDRYSIEILSRLLAKQSVSSIAITDPTRLKEEDASQADIIFLDLDMPEMNGYQVFEILRQKYGVQQPIIAYTVNLNEMATVRQMGFNGLVAKPVDASCFNDHLARMLNGEAIWGDCD